MKQILFSRTFPATHPKKGEPTYFLEKVLKSLDRGRNETYFMCQCTKCGWTGMSNVAGGGGQIADTGDYDDIYCPTCFSTDLDEPEDLGYYLHKDHIWPKHHTIRAGKRWKEGEQFAPKAWTGKPYRSKCMQFAPPVRISKVYDFEIRQDAPNAFSFYIDGRNVKHEDYKDLAANDGLSLDDLFAWFNVPHPFIGQIICWNENIKY